MIPATELQPPLPQPHRPSTSCDRHPEERFNGFCPLCLCERLALLEPSSSSSSSSRKPPISSSTAAAALKAIFRPSSSAIGGEGVGGGGAVSNRNKPASFFPELRRSKSFSASKNEGFSGVFEPQRKSCDVRARNTLWYLFNQDNERNLPKKETCRVNNGVNGTDITIEQRNLANFGSFSHVRGPVLESKEEDESELEEENENGVYEALNVGNVKEGRGQEIVEVGEEEAEDEPEQEPGPLQEEELKTMKVHMDLDSQNKKPPGRDFKEIAGSFWSAASVFSKKWQKWREKQKFKKRRNGGSATLPVEKPIGRQFRETQSEIAEYGFGRRSCDTDPRFSLDAGRFSLDAGRFSLDAGRFSVDDPRYSFDEPRASWDGYLIGRTFSRMPTMLSVVEDASSTHVLRTDGQIPVEEPMNSINEDDDLPGGSSQTRDYYSDSSRRRKSLDRSSSIRKTAAAVVAEIDEMKSVSNAKVMPATADFFPAPKMAAVDRVLRESNSNSNSMRDDCSEAFDLPSSMIGRGHRRELKKSRRWSKAWNIWSLINRRSGNRYDEDERFIRPNGVERSFSESWQDLRFDRNGDSRGALNPRSFRSNSSVSWRNSQNPIGSFGHIRKSSNDLTWNGNGRNKREEYLFERNNSARYSLNNVDNGVFRVMSTPLKSCLRNEPERTRPPQPHSIARSVLRLY